MNSRWMFLVRVRRGCSYPNAKWTSRMESWRRWYLPSTWPRSRNHKPRGKDANVYSSNRAVRRRAGARATVCTKEYWWTVDRKYCRQSREWEWPTGRWRFCIRTANGFDEHGSQYCYRCRRILSRKQSRTRSLQCGSGCGWTYFSPNRS